MKKDRSALPVVFTIIMLLCVLFIVWYLPAAGARRFQLEDLRKSLETSQGRERKQQHEYDETVAAIPDIQAELDNVLPLAEAAVQEVQDLKAERKQLREEKKQLESQPASVSPGEVTDHE